MSRIWLVAIIFLTSVCIVRGQGVPDTPHPKREFRGVWVATVANIDWPSRPGLSTERQKEELLRILDEHHKSGINAIMFQVRPASDAFYGKGRELWSRFITGKQGKAPNPYYDPLEFTIEEAHKRGMEVHAWFNPYRASTTLNPADIGPDHVTKQHPQWFFTYAGRKLFNPGIPEVRDYIVQVVLDVVRNYDIDGVHFDDYFYPYPEKNQVIQDREEFRKYGQGFVNIGDWRRHNVDTLIHELSVKIHASKKFVKFGISPFGIWRNKGQDPEGSESAGLDSYGTIYADARKWVREGWLDYINPQIYFPFFLRVAPYEKLVDWWSNNTYGKHLYIGHAAYRAIEKRGGWNDWKQIPDQIRFARQNPRVQGSVFFSSRSVTLNYAGIQDSLRNNFYHYPALPPQMLWLDDVPPQAPLNLQASASLGKVSLKWEEPIKARDGETAYGYVIYRFASTETVNTQDASKIIRVMYENTPSFTDEGVNAGSYYYVVTALDRLKNESQPSNNVLVSVPHSN
ncbi:glycoside hydrolase family 10 protein [Arcticibacter sp. MXS-1]|uniref:glycoside hydrolase family 10 protein n=1 Tax=Arcticibacter sp. MXS-1 TaxID=3341726 RepID=UPI0035A98B9C